MVDWRRTTGLRRVWRCQRGNQNPYIEEEQTTQWSKEKVQKDKQRSTKHTQKIKDRATRTPLKTGDERRLQLAQLIHTHYDIKLYRVLLATDDNQTNNFSCVDRYCWHMYVESIKTPSYEYDNVDHFQNRPRRHKTKIFWE